MDFVRERRSETELHTLLTEALTQLHAHREQTSGHRRVNS
jgi:hypothetical protein